MRFASRVPAQRQNPSIGDRNEGLRMCAELLRWATLAETAIRELEPRGHAETVWRLYLLSRFQKWTKSASTPVKLKTGNLFTLFDECVGENRRWILLPDTSCSKNEKDRRAAFEACVRPVGGAAACQTLLLFAIGASSLLRKEAKADDCLAVCCETRTSPRGTGHVCGLLKDSALRSNDRRWLAVSRCARCARCVDTSSAPPKHGVRHRCLVNAKDPLECVSRDGWRDIQYRSLSSLVHDARNVRGACPRPSAGCQECRSLVEGQLSRIRTSTNSTLRELKTTLGVLWGGQVNGAAGHLLRPLLEDTDGPWHDTWKCTAERCGRINRREDNRCATCDAAKPIAARTSWWECEEVGCKEVHFLTTPGERERIKCRKCARPRPRR